MRNSTWTPERHETLVRMWGEGLSAVLIAERLGGITSSAILKYIRRHGITSPDKPKIAAPPPPRPYYHNETPWTADRVGQLRQLWSEAKSCGEIAIRMGISRNAVIGKSFRLGLESRKRPGEPKGPRKPRKRPCRRAQLIAKRAAPNDPGLEEAYRASLVAPTEQPRQILTLTNNACRWPVGDPRHDAFYFCGAPMANFNQGNPYCPYHNRVAYREPAQ